MQRWTYTVTFKSQCFLVLVFRPTAALLEMLRCVVMVMMQRYGYMKPLLPALAVPTEVRRPVACYSAAETD